jgi:hypothetical protein
VIAPLVFEIAAGELAQFSIDERHQPVKRSKVAELPVDEQLRDLIWPVGYDHKITGSELS